MAELIECPECHTKRTPDTEECPNCDRGKATPRKRSIFQLSPEKILLVLALGWGLFHLVNSFFGKDLHRQSFTIDYAAVSRHMEHRVSGALPLYADLRQKTVPMLQDPSFAHGKLTPQMKAWLQEEHRYQQLVLWQGAARQVLMQAPPDIAPKLEMNLEAMTNLAIADNVLYQAWTIFVESCNGSMASYRPYLRAADDAYARAQEVLAGQFVGKPFHAAIVSEPGYLAKAPVPKRICPGHRQSRQHSAP